MELFADASLATALLALTIFASGVHSRVKTLKYTSVFVQTKIVMVLSIVLTIAMYLKVFLKALQ